MHHRHDNAETTPPAPAELVADLVCRGALAQVAYVAAELRLADHLAAAPMRLPELAAASGCHAPSLLRLMRALVAMDLCVELEDGSFALSRTGRLLGAGSGETLQAWLLWFGRHQWRVWEQLLQTVRSGESARRRMTGTDGLALFDRDAEKATLFNAAMVQLTRVVAAEVVRACDFSGVQRVVDVGGGHGALLEILLREHADVRGILLDRPHAMAGARILLQQAGVAERCEFVAGDFFDCVPRGADVYILKNIIHDWDDDRAATILRNCRDAMPGHGRLLVIERVLPARLEPCSDHRAIAHADLTMMLGPGGRERTRAEYDALLRAAGLSLHCVKPVVSGFGVLEAVKGPARAG